MADKTTMKALRYHKDGSLKLDSDTPIPTPGPKDILIKVHATAITADELTWPETLKREAPIPGHDIAGTIVSIGAEVQGGFKEDDNVFALTSFSRDGGKSIPIAAELVESIATYASASSHDWDGPRHHRAESS